MVEKTEKKTCSVAELEKQIFEKEGVTVVIRAPSNVQVDNYPYERKLADNKNLADLRDRIDKAIGNRELDYSIVLGDGNSLPHGRTNMSTARDSYKN
ncbi:hypothetical protein DDU33_03785 [Actinobacillus porcitonsillarum]|uniref:Uncharacterized protein n=1 Tax=Actinobacillus porcitonsillarum TaxID=189834 RepID=A0A2U8FJH5_9PAST|nr:hypothetical protein [Actinobacillus porcitonsillarum]AWI50666.1 hypothetical protein DDU33_03785 [Actinobacillus porcitonsillarum]